MDNETIPGTEGTGTQVEAGATQEIPATETETVETVPGESKPERTFTKDQVNKIMQRRVERSHNAFFTRYGVKDLQELDNLVGQSRSYGPLNEKYGELEKTHNDLLGTHKDLTKRYAFLLSNIDESRIPDIETYFKGKDIEIDENTLANELKTHPEWVKKSGPIQFIGAESTPSPDIDEREVAGKILGVNLSRRR